MKLSRIVALIIFIGIVIFLAIFSFTIVYIRPAKPEPTMGIVTPEPKQSVYYIGNNLTKATEYDLMQQLSFEINKHREITLMVFDSEGSIAKQRSLIEHTQENVPDVLIINVIDENTLVNGLQAVMREGTKVIAIGANKSVYADTAIGFSGTYEQLLIDDYIKQYNISDYRLINDKDLSLLESKDYLGEIILISSNSFSKSYVLDGDVSALIYEDNFYLASRITATLIEMLAGNNVAKTIELAPQFITLKK